MSLIIKSIKYPGNDLMLEILKRQKGEMWREPDAKIHFETGFEFDDRFTPEELIRLGCWLINQGESLRKKSFK